MARYQATIETKLTPEETFAYLSDFSNAQEWDPGVLEGERLDGGELGEGDRFRLVAEFMGRKTTLTYRIAEFDPPRAVTFVAETRTVTSRDQIVVLQTGRGTHLTYDADLQLKGPLRVLDPLLKIAFKRTGDRALAGLRAVLGRPRSQPRDIDAAA